MSTESPKSLLVDPNIVYDDYLDNPDPAKLPHPDAICRTIAKAQSELRGIADPEKTPEKYAGNQLLLAYTSMTFIELAYLSLFSYEETIKTGLNREAITQRIKALREASTHVEGSSWDALRNPLSLESKLYGERIALSQLPELRKKLPPDIAEQTHDLSFQELAQFVATYEATIVIPGWLAIAEQARSELENTETGGEVLLELFRKSRSEPSGTVQPEISLIEDSEGQSAETRTSVDENKTILATKRRESTSPETKAGMLYQALLAGIENEGLYLSTRDLANILVENGYTQKTAIKECKRTSPTFQALEALAQMDGYRIYYIPGRTNHSDKAARQNRFRLIKSDGGKKE